MLNSQSSFSQTKEEAIPLIALDNNTKKFYIPPEAEKFLRKLDAPLGIISVAGMYRTGKSYLLNRMLLNRQSGFSVGPTINPCTKGLWIWPKPIQGYSPDGSSINVLIVDTEGIGAMDEDSNHDTRIFTLAILLSSFFIYNSMGSIDENALSNLSFVINLSKHIQVKSNSSDQDVDEFASYFPSFMWVVRDFTLRLVDEDGESITSKEYLERSLEPQKGFSDFVEQKNRIRRLIKNFFKERDCCTIVRPLTSEENLQNLINVDSSKLRPEFVEQMNTLKKKVLNKVKAKMINGKKLNGEMFFNLMSTYVISINNGAVPNIENAWTYLCKNECEKGINEALENYEQSMKEGCLNKLPLNENDLSTIHQKSKETCLKIYKKRAVGNSNELYLVDLKKKIKDKYNFFKLENEKETKKKSLIFLGKAFSNIEQNVKSNKYKSIAEYEEEIILLSNSFNENGPIGPGKSLILNEFLVKATISCFDNLVRNASKESDNAVKSMTDNLNKLKIENNELKQNYLNQLQVKDEQIKKLTEEKEALELNMRETILNISKDKEINIKESNSKLEKLKSTYESQISELKQKLKNTEELFKTNDKKLQSVEVEYEKKRILLEKNYEHIIEEYKYKEQNYQSEIKRIKQENTNNLLKEIQIKNDNEYKKVVEQLEETLEKYQELEGNHKEKLSQFENEKQNLNDIINQNKQTIEDLNQQIYNIKNKIEKIKEKNNFNLDQLNSEAESRIESMRNTISELEAKNKELDETNKSTKNKYIREFALLQQKNEFLECEISELNSKYNELEASYSEKNVEIENRMNNLINDKERIEAENNETQMNLNNKILTLESESLKERKSLMSQIESLKERCHELEMTLKEENNKLSEENLLLNEKINDLEKLTNKMNESLVILETEKSSLVINYETQVKEMKMDYEDKQRELLSKMREETEEKNLQSEELLQQMKLAYENEKNKLEFKIFEERQNSDKKCNELIEEYETRLKDELIQKEDEINNLKDENREIIEHYQEDVTQAENEIAGLKQKIETLERFLNEANMNLSKTIDSNNLSMEQMNDKYTKEKDGLLDKIEKTTNELNKKNTEYAVLLNEKQQLDKNYSDILNKYEQLKNEVETTLKTREEEMINERQENYNKIKELSNRKLELEMEGALLNQQLDFRSKKILEMENILENTKRENEEKLYKIKQDIECDFKLTVEKLTKEKEELSQKLVKKRKENKETEINFNKQISILEKEKYILSEKIVNAENKKKEIMENNEREKENLSKQINELNSKLNSSKDVNIQENKRLKTRIEDLENERNELSNQYEKDKALWDSKLTYLDNQKENSKKEMKEMIKKYDITIENLYKKHLNEKEKIEITNKAVLNSLEERYKVQLREINENNQKLYSDLLTSNKNYEKEIKSLNEKLQVEQKFKLIEENSLRKKVNELTDSEEKLKQALSNCKSDFNTKLANLTKNFESDKEQLKKNINEIEQKFRESENKRSTLLFELEKVKNTAEIEKKSILERNQEKVDQIKILERRIDLLTRENEKARNDKSQNKNHHNKNSLNRISFSTRQNSANKENKQIFENSFDKSMDSTIQVIPKPISPTGTVKTKSRQDSINNNYNNLNIDFDK